MDTALLVVFQEVARRGSFTGAAESLGYTQSAVSRQISTLEGEVGAVLFDRLPRGVRLTEEGLRLRHLLDDSMFVALHPDHRLAGREELRLVELAGEDWIAGSSRPENTLISAATLSGFRPRITYVVGEWIAKQGLVAAGLGVTL